MTRTVSLINTTTGRAGLRGVGWINQEQRHACLSRLVVQKGAQLKERPRMQRGSLGAPKPYPRANACQIFQCNRALCALRFSHHFLAQVMVRPFCETGLVTRQSLEPSFGRFSSLALEFGSQTAVAIAYIVDRTGRMDFTIGVNRDICYAQVNAQYALNVLWHWFLNFTGSGEKEFIAEQHQVRLPLAHFEQSPLMFTTNEGNQHSAIYRPDGNRAGQPAQNAIIVSQTPQRLELAAHPTREFIGVGNFGNTANGHLRREFELLAYLAIAQVMKIILSEGLRLPSLLTDKLTGSIARCQRLAQGLNLFGCWQEFDLCDQFHVSSIEHLGYNVKSGVI